MARGSKHKPATTIDTRNGLSSDHKPYVRLSLNPPVLNTDADGSYIQEQLEQIKRRHEGLESFKHGIEGQITVIKRKIASRKGETGQDEPPLYRRMVDKEYRSPHDLEMLYVGIFEIEALYNQIPPLERQLRDVKRQLIITYPPQLLKLVYRELREQFNAKKYWEENQ